jgi:hypothetical protein
VGEVVMDMNAAVIVFGIIAVIAVIWMLSEL